MSQFTSQKRLKTSNAKNFYEIKGMTAELSVLCTT